jgi:hypothetical protein
MASYRVITATRSIGEAKRHGWVVECQDVSRQAYAVSIMFATKQEAEVEAQRLTAQDAKTDKITFVRYC